MKKKILINLETSIVDLKVPYEGSIKKSLEFFLGRMLNPSEIAFNHQTHPVEFILSFLEKNNIYLREKAVQKKFNEYLFGYEFNGLVKGASIALSKNEIEKNSIDHKIVIFSCFEQEITDYLVSMASANSCSIIIGKDLKSVLEEQKPDIFVSKNINQRELATSLDIETKEKLD